MRTDRITVGVLAAMSLAGIIRPALAHPETFDISDDKGRDSVSFTSDAPIELIVGHTNKVAGQVTIDDSLDLSKKPLQADFSVDLASIDTGIPLRNEHMRDNFLQTAKFPKAEFKVTSIAAAPAVLKDGQTAKVKATGQFSLHGVTKTKEIDVDVTYHTNCKSQAKFESCDLIQIKSTFPLAFKDYQIQRPEIVFQKLADTVIVTISATAHREAAKATGK